MSWPTITAPIGQLPESELVPLCVDCGAEMFPDSEMTMRCSPCGGTCGVM